MSLLSIERLITLDKEKSFNFEFEIIAGESGLKNTIKNDEINRPGLALAGYFDYFEPNRIQIFGKGEIEYIKYLINKNNIDNIYKFFSYRIPVIIVTNNSEIPDILIELGNKNNITVLRTKLSSKDFILKITNFLSDYFAPTITFHGDFISVYNMGVLILGKSGIGKSESVLSLITKGHQFVCDDMVKIKKIHTHKGDILIGEPYYDYGPYLEIRGIGIINISDYFGQKSIIKSQKLDLVIELKEWDNNYEYDRLGMDELFFEILDIKVPKKEIPVNHGRDIPLLIEIATYRQLLLNLGINSAKELDKLIIANMNITNKII